MASPDRVMRNIADFLRSLNWQNLQFLSHPEQVKQQQH